MGLSLATSPPSTRLPPIRHIHDQPIEALANLVEYLRAIYNSPIRGARRIDRKTSKHAFHLGAHDDENALLDALRTDEFERAYTVRWLTALVSRTSDLLIPLEGYSEAAQTDAEAKVDALVRSATSLIALCAGTTAARTLTRRYAFYAPSLDADVELSLTDVPISADSDYPSVGTQTWGSACLMAEMLVEEPEKFGLDGSGRGGDVRILELGAGTGLVSLTVAKFLSMRGAGATVVASDYHPAVLSNLEHNIRANFPPGTLLPGLSLTTHPLDWSMYPPSGRVEARDVAAPFDKPFDVILGADVIYEPSHTTWIRDTVSALLPHPAATHSTPPRFHLVMPLRPTHASETRMVEEAFLATNTSSTRPDPGLALRVLDQETIVCETEDARGSEVEYVHYTIGWA